MSTGPKPGIHPEEALAGRARQRQALRRQGIARRMALSAATHESLSTRICELIGLSFPELSHLHVGFCWPYKNEPDLRPLMQRWLARGNPGFAALLPVVIDAGRALAFRAWTPDCTMQTDRYGIPTPSSGDFLTPDALLIPVNAFDVRGYRIGYGGGYFDRTLAALTPRPLAVGVGFEINRLPSIRPESHDQRLDWLVTEAGAVRVGGV